MKYLPLTLLCTGLVAGCNARAVGNLAEVRIVDRDDGTVLTPHYYRGEYWVAGRPGARYSIEIHNRLGERLLAVTSVDGVNVLSGETAGWDQTGYVFGASERYEITGWRKSDTAVAAFTFCAADNSYAQRTGRPDNVGVIGIALFRERPSIAYYAPPAYAPPEAGQSYGNNPANSLAARDEAPAAAAALKSAPLAMERSASLQPQLGTGHGEREYSYVSHTDFQRQQPRPNEVIRIRYDSPDHLVAMGIITRPRPVAIRADPFPATHGGGYVPDPPG